MKSQQARSTTPAISQKAREQLEAQLALQTLLV